ncbi:hypothetical protein ACNVED_03850 [Legionella sp. D16C41]|uniref:hypothetical protein n=1 Tax=Legionella sp. D16C41 TaxID=3402688 RepID=UPI003AF5F6BC
MKFKYEEILTKLIQNDSSLTVVDFRQANLSSIQSREIFKALESNNKVITLKFLGNNSSDEAAIALGSMLEKNHTIEDLQLGSNEINNKDIVHIINGLKNNDTVTSLDLNSNLFDIADPIADLLEHNNWIREIDLTNSNINNDGFLEIKAALERNENSSLTAFNVYYPPIPCLDDFDNLCRANAKKYESSVRLF